MLAALVGVFGFGASTIALAEENEGAGVADPSEYGDRVEVNSNGMKAVTADMMPEGTYSIAVDTDSGMFNVVDCQLTIQDGAMSAVLTLGGNGYEALFMGTGAEAIEAGPDATSPAVVVDGKYTYTVSVPALNQELDCAAFSKKKQKWYDHTIMFDASTLGTDVLPASSYASDAPADLFALGAVTALEDGEYRMNVAMEGGSGRASVSSPALVTVKDGQAIATIEWSSEFYDYMVVDGYKYLQTNTEGNSTFTIPVKWFDDPFPIVADTTRMGAPHEIEYTLAFDQDSAVAGGAAAGGIPVVPIVIAVAVVVVAVVVVVVVMRSRKAKAQGGTQ